MVEEKTRKLEKIDILNDACFKSLFRSIEARGMFARFLSAITGIDKEALFNAELLVEISSSQNLLNVVKVQISLSKLIVQDK